jgi:hypothetical protein
VLEKLNAGGKTVIDEEFDKQGQDEEYEDECADDDREQMIEKDLDNWI